LAEGNSDNNLRYDLRMLADINDLSKGFEITFACASNFTVAEFMRCTKLNIPNLNPEHHYLFSDNISKDWIRDYKQIMSMLIEMGLGYDRWVHITYELEGDNTAAIQTRNQIGAGSDRGDIQTIEDIHVRRGCLAGFSAFGGDGANPTKRGYDFCIQPNPFTDPVFENDRSVDGLDLYPYSIIHGLLHEYFHHFQRMHTLDGMLDMEGSSNCCGVALNVPPFWSEGSAVIFPDLFLYEKFYDLEHTVRTGFKLPGFYDRSFEVCQGMDYFLCDRKNGWFIRDKETMQGYENGKSRVTNSIAAR